MHSVKSPWRWRGTVPALAAFAILVGGCSSLEGPNIGSDDPVATTQASIGAVVLVVDSPQVGEPFPSPGRVVGRTSLASVGYRLTAGGSAIGEGTASVTNGGFEVSFEFTNSCCTEMLLEVFDADEGEMAVSIPLTYPGPG